MWNSMNDFLQLYTLNDILILQRKPSALQKYNLNLFYDWSNCQMKFSFG